MKKNKFLIIFDDILDADNSNHIKYNSKLNHIFTNGRHLGISIILSIQYMKAINPLTRTNADYSFVFNCKNHNIIDYIYKEYSSNKPRDEFIEMLDQNSKEYNMVVIDNTNKDNQFYRYNINDKNK